MTTKIICNHDLSLPVRILNESSQKTAIERLIDGKVEACSEMSENVISTEYHAFLSALHMAFADHRPFVISPDAIWLLISQGFAQHVNAHSEAMRHHFVQHESKEVITVRRDHFVKGSETNTWEDVFEEFSEQIKKKIGESNHDQIVVNFSTTGPIEKAANEIVLMDTMKSYYKYEVSTLCGIPEIWLEGDESDWARMIQKTAELGKIYDLEWWTERMLPILNEITLHSKGEGTVSFWKDIYKWHEGSGGSYINGWINKFIPYISLGEDLIKNPLLDSQNHAGISIAQLPSGLSLVPFNWEYLGTTHKMEFIAGFVSYTQEEVSLAIKPKIGWAVRDIINDSSKS